MITLRAGRTCLLMGAAALLASRARAQDPKAILQRAESAMKNAKTYQATMVMNMSMGQMGQMGVGIDMKMIPGKKMYLKMSPIGQATGQMAMAAAFINMQMVDDGTTMWMYSPAMKVYRKQPHNPATMKSPVNFPSASANVNLKMLAPASIGGRPAYAVEVIPKNAPAGANQKMIVYIDKATNRFVQMTMSGNTPTQGNMPPQKMDMKVIVKSDKIDAPLPASIFSWRPPADAKEAKGMMGMPGAGMPGVGGGPHR